jgi:tRNA A-37 threonylcarbamoyl transferase component Bud32
MPASDHANHSRALRGGNVVYADADAKALLHDCVDELSAPAEPHWRRVKRSASRTVYVGSVRGQGIYLKHFHSSSLIHRLGRGLGLSDAKTELDFMTHLNSVGVATVPPLAAMCRNGIEWVASRAVGPADPAEKWHVAQLDRGRKGRRLIQQAIVALARMVGQMHAAGVLHRDLHCGNVLIRTDGAEPAPILTDLHRVRKRRRLSRRARAANLALLFHDRYAFTTRTERLRFLRHYLSASGARGTLRGWQRLVESFARRHTLRQHARKDRRVLGRNRYFAPLRLQAGWRGHVVLASKRRMADSQAAEHEFSAEQWRHALRDPEALFVGDGVQVIKDTPSGVVIRRRLRVGPHQLEVYIKRPRRKRRWKAALDCFRAARPTRAFRLGHALLARRIATALPLATLERRRGPLLVDSILITEAVAGPRLNDFLNTWLGRPAKPDVTLTTAQQRQLAQEVLWQLGRLVRNLHDNRFAHRDLKASNLLVHWSVGSPPRLVLVDLDGLRLRRRVGARRRFQGLMRLNVSLLKCPPVNHAGRLRMLLGYLRRPGAGRISFKPYWRVLEEWSARKLRQQIRSRRRRQKAARRPVS